MSARFQSGPNAGFAADRFRVQGRRPAIASLDRFIGTPPCSAEDWLASAVIRAASPLQRPDAQQRLVVVAPHPDDEILAAGGLIVQHRAAGGRVVVVGVTDGEGCLGRADASARHAVAVRRRCERRESLLRLGGAQTTIALGVPDGEASRHEDRIADDVAALLAPGDVLVSTWRWDGHPDHEATARACALAATLVDGIRLLEAPVWMAHWARPDTAGIDWGELRRLGLDVETVSRKQSALACHRSQLEPLEGRPPILDEAILERSRWPLELFFDVTP